MGLIETTFKVSIAVLIIYAGGLMIDTRFRILEQWGLGLIRFSQRTGGIPSEVWGALFVIVILGFLIYGPPGK